MERDGEERERERERERELAQERDRYISCSAMCIRNWFLQNANCDLISTTVYAATWRLLSYHLEGGQMTKNKKRFGQSPLSKNTIFYC